MQNKNIVITNTKSALEQSKAQKQFYKHLKSIEKLKAQIITQRDLIPYFATKKADELIPAEKDCAAVEVEWVKALYRWRGHSSIGGAEINTMINEMVTEAAYDLIETFNFKELQPLYDDCAPTDFETEQIRSKKEEQDEMKARFKEELDIDIEEDLTEENIFEFLAQAKEKVEAQHAAAEEKRAKRKKTPKQAALAEQKAAEKELETKSVRDIYMSLVKEFHPDREQDEAERERKTTVMQRITAAYESNDLPELLRLQLEYEQINADNITELADEKLARYNKVLKGQIQQLEQECYGIEMQFHAQNPQVSQYFHLSKAVIDNYVKTTLQNIAKDKKLIEKTIVTLLGKPADARKYFKSVKKERDEDDGGFDFGEMLARMFRQR